MKTIFSIYPRPMFASRMYGKEQGQSYAEFRLAAGSIEKPALLEIDDCFQTNYYGENVGYKVEPIRAEEVAKDLIRSWSTTLIGCEEGHGPGIGICDGKTPTREQLEYARASQESYFAHLVEVAETAWKENKPHKITDHHRAAAKWLGREDFEWMRSLKQEQVKDCPLCTKRIPARAIICPECKQQIAPKPKELMFDGPSETPASPPSPAPQPPSPPTPPPPAVPVETPEPVVAKQTTSQPTTQTTVQKKAS